MILPLMNITVIPFLLEAFVSVKNYKKWSSGPEYTFKLSKTTALLMDILITENVTAIVKCRPNVSSQRVENVLYCHGHKVNFTKMTQRMVNYKLPDRFFKLKFGMQGVEDLLVKRKKMDSHIYDIIPDVIEQFNMGIDLSIEAGSSMKNYENETSGTHVISSFMQTNNEGTMRDKCNTSLTIKYTVSNHSHKDEKHRDHKNKSKSYFHLKFLPISYTNPADKTFSINRKKVACIDKQKNIKLLNGKWQIDKMTQYYNVLKLYRTKPKFTSYTHLEGYVFFPRSYHKYYFWEDVHLELHHIRPAQELNEHERVYYENIETKK